MRDTDDTIQTGGQAHEDTMLASVEAGLMPGSEAVQLDTPDDVVDLRLQLANEEVSLVMYRVPRDQALMGYAAGQNTGYVLGSFADVALNKVSLAFDGWADDPRELWEVPEVVDFCRGLVGEPGSHLCRCVIAVLFDEVGAAVNSSGELVHPDAFQMAGSLWLAGVVCPGGVHVRNPQSPSGWDRDIGKACDFRTKLYDGETT
jgi:hypothetical protein